MLSALTALVLYVAARNPVSLSGWLYAGALLAACVALLVNPWVRYRRWVRRLGLGALMSLVLIGAGRCTMVGSSWRGGMSMQTWPDGDDARLLDRIIDERDLAFLGLEVLPYTGMIFEQEARGARAAFAKVYGELAERHGNVASPFAATWLGLQRAAAYDVVLFSSKPRASRAVVLLHGSTGNYVFECFLMARALASLGVLTVCPSTGVEGAWWKGDGPAILDSTLQQLARRGVKRVVLAGLSNGGIGASLLASRVAGARRGRARVVGLLLLFGLTPRAPRTWLPTLVLHASGDARMSARAARGYVARAKNARLVTLRGDHFAMAKRPRAVGRVVRAFVKRLLGGR
ncbi:MAG: hypothetical protein KC503_32755 [Myxococcales bacterium]|nr:hypothetical protein [Myxococcales bacterium]